MEVANVFIVLAAAFVPALVWLFFFLREDLHPEPKRLIIKTFLFGAAVTVPTFAIQSVADYFLKGEFVILVATLAFLEEFFKFLAAWFAVRRNPAFDEPVDAMIYTIAAALGFATVENIFVTGSAYPLSASLGVFFAAGGALSILIYRFVGATLLHALASSLVGYAWARGRIRKNPRRFVALGLAIAGAMHAVFNFLIYRFEYENILVPALFLALAGFFVLVDFERLKR
ncbi:MAG: PrsW family intramembrane metalloprotease [Candidatus Brennerbacteria bacterium]|nr:PrsW family intramembrane metalloprotease [Candidatus Brennerbacteria bacterium]